MRAVEYIEIDVDEFAAVDRAAAFDGTNDYLTRGAGLTGAADSKLWTFSCWIYLDIEGNATLRWVLGSAAAVESTRLVVLANNTFEITGCNAAETVILRAISSIALRLNRWNHVMFSVDMSDTLKRHMVINDVVDDLTSWNTYTNDTIDFTETNWYIGAHNTAAQKMMGRMADFWMEDGVYIDLSKEPNRRKFISDKLGPVDLDTDGSNPTGTSPIIYLSGALASWHTNKGTGGGFTENGELGLAGYVWETYRFAVPTMYLPQDIPAIPSIKSMSHTPATISLGKDLGQRANISVTLGDHKHRFTTDSYDTGSFWGKWRGRYGTKLRNREFRLVKGVEGQSRQSMTTRYFAVDTTDGPTVDGIYTIVAKDYLKLADDDRSQAPRLSNGKLSGSIDTDDTALTLTPAGIGNAEYPSSGYICIGGKEIVSFTRTADALTVVRGQLGSLAQTHNSGDRLQLCLYYDGDDVADIVNELLTGYVTGIESDMINLAEWQAETAQYLGVIYNTIITEPTGVRKLLNELIDQAALAIFWDDEARQIRLKVLREIATDVETFDEDRIIANSLKVKELPQSRISQIWTFYGQRNPTDQSDNKDNYRAALADVDLTLESAYGAPAINTVTARWIGTQNAAQRHNGIKLSRFRDPPRSFSFNLWRDALISPAGGYLLRWWANQNSLGEVQSAPIQVTSVRYESDFVYVTAEEMLASGVILLTHTVFLRTTGSLLSWVVPANWNDAENEISVIGGGGSGRDGGATGGRGGGGAAFSRVTNLDLTPSASISYRVGIGGAAGGDGQDGGDTWFNGANLAASTVGAKGGKAGANGAGGLASEGTGTLKTSGGDGGFGGNKNDNETGAGGGGGSGGPNGNGANGGSNGTDSRCGGGGGGADGGSPGGGASDHSNVGDGGNNRFNYGGGNASQPSGREGGGGRGGERYSYGGNPGGAGEQMWTQTVAPVIPAGPGGGGGGAADNSGTGGAGGLYGGGGGGARAGAGGAGAQGIIVITWKEPE